MFDWKSQAFPGYRPVREPWMTKIVDVHWKSHKLFLYLNVYLFNGRFGWGLDPVAIVPPPGFVINTTEVVTKLDEYRNPEINGQTEDGFLGCMQYVPQQTAFVGWGPAYTIPPPEGPLMWQDGIMGPVGLTAQEAFDRSGELYFPHALRSSVDRKSCPAYFDPSYQGQYPVAYIGSWNDHASREFTYYVQLAIVPFNYFSRKVKQIEYLFAIDLGKDSNPDDNTKPGDDIITINVSGLMPTESEPNGLSQYGFGTISAAVFSTARKSLAKIPEVADEDGDIDYEDQRLDPDHVVYLDLRQDNQGTYHFSVNKHEDPKFLQTDNYGSKFQPYRITVAPMPAPDRYYEEIPDQPPILLPLPPGAKAPAPPPAIPVG